jgi:hypothetical protein
MTDEYERALRRLARAFNDQPGLLEKALREDPHAVAVVQDDGSGGLTTRAKAVELMREICRVLDCGEDILSPFAADTSREDLVEGEIWVVLMRPDGEGGAKVSWRPVEFFRVPNPENN